MISEATYNQLTPGQFQTRILDVITVKGKSHAVKVFEVYGTAEDVLDADTLAYYQTYQAAFDAYLARDFDLARAKFSAARNLHPHDPASTWLLSRIADLNPTDLPDNWDGSTTLQSK
jgi:TolA-binding protein